MLATIVRDAPVKLNLKDCAIHQYDKAKVLKLFNKLNFKSLISKLPNDEFETDVQEALF
jgi:DNA polymerase-1